MSSQHEGPCARFRLDMAHPQFAVCMCGYRRDQHHDMAKQRVGPIPTRRFSSNETGGPRDDADIVPASSPVVQDRKRQLPKRKKVNINYADILSGEMPDLGGIRAATDLREKRVAKRPIKISTEGIELSDDSEENDDQAEMPPDATDFRSDSLNNFDDLFDDLVGDLGQSDGPPAIPPKQSKPVVPPKSSKPTVGQRGSRSNVNEITASALDSFFDDLTNNPSPSTNDSIPTVGISNQTSSDLLEVLAREGRRSKQQATTMNDGDDIDWLDELLDEEESVSADQGGARQGSRPDLVRRDEASPSSRSTQSISSNQGTPPPVLRRGSIRPPKPTSPRIINAPPGLDPLVFDALPRHMQEEQLRAYERERKDRELAERIARMEVSTTTSPSTGQQDVSAPQTTVPETPTKVPPGVDPTVFASLPRSIQKELLAAHSSTTTTTTTTTSPMQGVATPTTSSRRVQCPFCKAILTMSADAQYAACPDCNQTIASPKADSGSSKIRVTCTSCNSAMLVPSEVPEAVCPTCWSHVKVSSRVRRDSMVSTAQLQSRRHSLPTSATSTGSTRSAQHSSLPRNASAPDNNVSTRNHGTSIRVHPVSQTYSGLDRRRAQLLRPLSERRKGMVECVLWRLNGGKEFRMYLIDSSGTHTDEPNHQFMLSGKKDTFTRGLNFIISMAPEADRESPGYIGKLRGDGTQLHYVLYDSGLPPKHAPRKYMNTSNRDVSIILRQQLGDVTFQLPDSRQERRKMCVLIPEPFAGDQGYHRWAPMDESETLRSKFYGGNRSRMTVCERDTDDEGVLWAFKSSTKNFTLLLNGRQRVFAFGKAFAISVSSCVAKIS